MLAPRRGAFHERALPPDADWPIHFPDRLLAFSPPDFGGGERQSSCRMRVGDLVSEVAGSAVPIGHGRIIHPSRPQLPCVGVRGVPNSK
jgi:hypothetical protein